MKYLTEGKLHRVMEDLEIPLYWLDKIRGKSRITELVAMRKGISIALHNMDHSCKEIGRLLNRDDTTIGYYVRGRK